MGSSICESNFREKPCQLNRGYPLLYEVTHLWSGIIKGKLYIVTTYGAVPTSLKKGVDFLSQVPMEDGTIDLLTIGLETAVRVGQHIHTKTGQAAGIAEYNGLEMVAHINARKAAEDALKNEKPFLVYN